MVKHILFPLCRKNAAQSIHGLMCPIVSFLDVPLLIRFRIECAVGFFLGIVLSDFRMALVALSHQGKQLLIRSEHRYFQPHSYSPLEDRFRLGRATDRLA
jgi:hypothetical protein